MRDEAHFIHIDDFDFPGELAGKATTHEQRSPGSPALQGRPRRPLSSSLRAAWDWIMTFDERHDMGLYGDVIGAVCLIAWSIGSVIFLPLFFLS